MRCWWLLLLAPGCYAPNAAPGGPCSADGRCPSELACEHGVCVVAGTGTQLDAAAIDAPIVMVDAPVAPIDAPPDAAPQVDPTLMAHWKFDDSPTNGALDSTGRGHTATCIACPAVVTGKVGNAYRFDPVLSQFLRVPDHPDFRGVFTIAAWIVGDNTANQIAIMSKPVGTSTGNSWQLELLTDDDVSFSGGSNHTLEGGVTLAPQTWHHVAGSWDGTTKRLYVDGVLVGSSSSSITYDTQPVVLGGDDNAGAPALPWDGVLDELRVYSRVLTLAEIQALAQ